MRNSHLSLLAVAKIALGDKDMAHRQHIKTTKLLGRVEHNRRETTWHLTIQTNLNTRLDLVLILHKQIKELLSVEDGLTVVRHETDEGSIPLVGNLSESRCTGAHKDLTDAIVKGLDSFLLHSKVRLGRYFFSTFVLEVPHSILVCGCRWCSSTTNNGCALSAQWLDANLESTHIKEEVRIVGTEHADERVVPIKRRHTARKTILNVPEDSAAQVDIAFEQSHAAITRPTLLVAVSDGIFIVRIRMLDQIALDEILALG